MTRVGTEQRAAEPSILREGTLQIDQLNGPQIQQDLGASGYNRWPEQMELPVRFPQQHAAFMARCHAAGQWRQTSLLPAECTFVSRWRLQLSVTPAELDAVRMT